MYHENAYKNYSNLPNTNPRCEQSVEIVVLIQIVAIESEGLNLNKLNPPLLL